REFNASKPNEKWCTDITEVVAPGLPKAYLCTVLDLYDRYPVGYAISKHNDTALVQSAYEQAIQAYPTAHP
ncbi:DDE-type integrase/transposase/recombinase, partial [Lactobacillus ultunensis]